MTSNEMESDDAAHRSDDEDQYVSGRFLTDFLGTLERHSIPAVQLLGDLPIPHDQGRLMGSRVEWADFVEFMKRLERHVGGPVELDALGARIDELKPASALRGLAGLTASPLSLYRAAIRWALVRAMPGIEARIDVIDENHIEIHARLRPGMRPCPQIFAFASGGARALPRILGLRDALVEAEIGRSEAAYRVTLPPSPTLYARAKRFVRTLFSAGSVVHVLEAQQLELHAEHDALEKAHRDLAANEERYRAFADATVDVLCELDEDGHIAFVSASVEELLGYAPEQVTGSHFRLWVPRKFHAVADAYFEAVAGTVAGQAVSRELVALHSADGRRIVAELSMRSFVNSRGQWRMACVVRDLSDAFVDAKDDAAVDFVDSAVEETCASDSRPNPVLQELAAHHERGIRRRSVRARIAPPKSNHLEVHPLERSLERLLAALRSHTKASEAQNESRLTRAGAAMTRIVDSALIEAEHGAPLRLDWIEIAKLLEAVSVGPAIESEGPPLRLRIGDEPAPTEIRAQNDLLMTGLSSLIEAARLAAPNAGEIVMSVSFAPEAGPGSPPIVDFVIESVPAPDTRASASSEPISAATREFVALSEAIASDVATAHDGELIVEQHEADYCVRRLRIIAPE